MKLELFGMKLRLDVLIITLVLGMLLGAHLLCGCSRVSLKEGMELMSSELGYKMGEGVKSSWENKPQQKGSSLEWREQDHDAYGSKFVSPDENVDFFADTEFAPECCGSSYSSKGGLINSGATTGGCACMNKEQVEYINSRGGNRSSNTEF